MNLTESGKNDKIDCDDDDTNHIRKTRATLLDNVVNSDQTRVNIITDN